MAQNWREMLETNAWSQGKGAPNPLIPAALKEWSIPIDQLPAEGRKLYESDPAGAKRLLAEAGHPNGIKSPVETTPGYGPDWMDAVQVVAPQLEERRHRGGPQAEGVRGVRVSSAIFGKFEKSIITLRGGTTDRRHLLHPVPARRAAERSGVNDPKLTEMIKLQRRTFDDKKRREHRLRHPALRLAAGVLLLRPLGERGRRLDALRQELRPEHRPRLRRPPHGRLAGQVTGPRLDGVTEALRPPPPAGGDPVAADRLPHRVLLPRLIPGDVVQLMLEEKAYGKDLEDLRAKLGLNRPIYIQYFEWLGQVTCAGTSASRSGPSARCWRSWPGRLPDQPRAGRARPVLRARRSRSRSACSRRSARTRWPTFVARSMAILGLSVPGFWIATLVVAAPRDLVGLEPAHPVHGLLGGPAGPTSPSSCCPPSSSASPPRPPSCASPARMLLEVLRQDYVRTAWAKGLRERVVVVKHSLKNALIPVITVLGLQVAQILGGTVIFEQHLRAARHGPLPLRRDQPARLPGHPGHQPAHRVRGRRDQPDRRRVLRLPGPADPLLEHAKPRTDSEAILIEAAPCGPTG